MRPRTRRLVEALILASTSFVLLGHGGDVPTCFTHAKASRTYNIVGTCGAPGIITVSTGPCDITITGDDVGLPTSGNLGATLDDGFDLYGSVNEDWDLECGARQPTATAGVTPAPGSLTLGCDRRPSARNPTPLADFVDWCRATLIPVTAACDLDACPPVACAINEHTAFQAPRCCPTCVVNGPNDVIPVPPPPVCHPDECPACPAGQEVLSTDTTCCACQAPPQSCLDGRTQWLAEVNARWSSSAVSCAVDADCVITSVASRCETTCYGAIADAQVAALTTWAAGRADELCASCTTEPPICPGGALTPAVCSMGTCVLTPP